MKPDIESLRPYLGHVLRRTSLREPVVRGKVRDIYPLGDEVLFVSTDRLTGFDRFLTHIPFKGAVLNATSQWWFHQTAEIVPNHLLKTPDPSATLARRCEMLPIEFVVRGYLTGATDTSLWTHYKRGERIYCGHRIPDGLKKNDRLPEPLLTPTTKSADHDRPVSEAEILRNNLLAPEDWAIARDAALDLFRFGQKVARAHGLVLVDTKYEFGKLPDGTIVLADEIHTPDSSRYWVAEGLEDRLEEGLEPENIDKEFIRLWYREHSNPYADANLPEPPEDLILELSARYIQLHNIITGTHFKLPVTGTDPLQRLVTNLALYLQ